MPAVSVLEPGSSAQLTELCCTDVPMRDYRDEEIRNYIATGDPFDHLLGDRARIQFCCLGSGERAVALELREIRPVRNRDAAMFARQAATVERIHQDAGEMRGQRLHRAVNSGLR